jgi:hypothetical protein
MSEWITDRLPTKQDADEFGDVWVTIWDGFVCDLNWKCIKPQMPWQPTNKPGPYVKPKRWTVEWVNMFGYWALIDGENRVPIYGFTRMQREAAQRIADIYNEVMP